MKTNPGEDGKPPARPPSPRRAVILFALLLGAAVLAFMGWRKFSGSGDEANRGNRANARASIEYPVETARILSRFLVYSMNAVGTVEAFENVQVTTRVAGVVDRVLFVEGDSVTVGKVLAEIETERYQLAAEAARAALEKARASLADVEAGLARREAAGSRLVAGEEIATWRTKTLTARADVSQARAALDQAELNLRDAYVRAPMAGVIQTRSVKTGQYVPTGAVLATLVRRDPLLLRFSLPGRDAGRVQTGMTAHFRVTGFDRPLSATITLVADQADDQTRLVEITAEVTDTAASTLRPGSFTEVTVPVGDSRPAPVVPLTAVRPSEHGFIAYVVENGKARRRIVTLGMATIDGQTEILSGLEEGEDVVVRGGEALSDGVAVRVGAPVAPSSDPGTRPESGSRSPDGSRSR